MSLHERISGHLYVNLVKERDELLDIVKCSNPHPTQFIFDRESFESYMTLYSESRDNLQNGKPVAAAKSGHCPACKAHFLGRQPEIDHEKDIDIGLQLEKVFMATLNNYFLKQGYDLNCEKADREKLNMPDFKVTNTCTGKTVIYFEFKCIFKPFIKIQSKLSHAKCYSHSMTLDCDKKLEKQLHLIESNGLLNKTVYVYWYDIPCVKGIFWMMSEDVKRIFSTTVQYSRKVVKGDYRQGKKVGHSDKIYLPLHEMRDFSCFIAKIIEDSTLVNTSSD